MFVIYPYQRVSHSALLLAEALDGVVIKRVNSRYKHKPWKRIINWGVWGEVPYPVEFNQPAAVNLAAHKTKTFKRLEEAGVPTCKWTKDLAVAQKWAQKGFKVLGRDTESGMGGHGITVYTAAPQKQHKFYTRFFIKTREFRVHVLRGQAFWVQEKKKKAGVAQDGVDKYVRSHDRGWCFAFHHLANDPCPELVKQVAVQAIEALGLDFGGVDIGWNKNGRVCVFEINTAPGIENSTLQAYKEAFEAL